MLSITRFSSKTIDSYPISEDSTLLTIQRTEKQAVPGVSLEACGCTLEEGRFRLDVRKKFFTVRVVRHWQRSPREAVAAPSLAVLKARLDGALSTLVWWKDSQPMAGGLEPDDL